MRHYLKIIGVLLLLFSSGAAYADFIDFKGGKIWYNASNLKSRSACELYVHGNSASSAWIKPTTDLRIKEGKCVVVFDLPGHGKSSRLDNYEVPIMVEALLTVITQSGIVKHQAGYNIIGWSYGGDISIHTIEKDSLPKLKSLVLVGTAPLNLTARKLPAPYRTDTFAMSVLEGQYNVLETLSKKQKALMTLSFMCHNSKECNVPQMLFHEVLKTDGKIRSGIMISFQKRLIHDEIHILKNRDSSINLCVMYGKYDALINPDYMKSVSELINADSVAEILTGHSSMYENPQLVSFVLDQCFL